MPQNQLPRDPGPQPVELGRPVTRFSEEDDARFTDPLQQRLQVSGLDVIEALRGLAQELSDGLGATGDGHGAPPSKVHPIVCAGG